MDQPINHSLEELFAATAPDSELRLRVIKKRGRPWLYLPLNNCLAAKSLTLYSAQSVPARWGKTILGLALAWGVPLPLGKTSLHFRKKDELPAFLSSLVESKEFSKCAILCGNANTAGRRFIILLFDDTNRPAVVVKVGSGKKAEELIADETSFLAAAAKNRIDLPHLVGTIRSKNCAALALKFIAGDSPPMEEKQNRKIIGNLLASWLDKKNGKRLTDFAEWTTLKNSGNPWATKIEALWGRREVYPGIAHGDFVPWNIKVSPVDGAWQVLDWERGKIDGLPGWDWFHYEIQTGILIKKLEANALLSQLEKLLVDEYFVSYAQAAGMEEIAKGLALAYMIYCVEILKPSEGLATVKALLEAAGRNWLRT